MKIQVRKCGFTGKMFESDREYLCHLQDLRCVQSENRARRKRLQEFGSWLEDARYNITSMTDLEHWVNANWRRILEHSRARQQPSHLDMSFTFTNTIWRKFVSNSHSCPLDGVTNWRRDPALPMGYPGWKGSISIQVLKGRYEGFYSDLFGSVPICIGGGGAGHYELILYASDWPGIHVSQALLA